jgi:hypothetical protein
VVRVDNPHRPQRRAPAADLGQPGFTLDADTTVHARSGRYARRETRNHLAVLSDGDRILGAITLADVLGRPFPRPESAAA